MKKVILFSVAFIQIVNAFAQVVASAEDGEPLTNKLLSTFAKLRRIEENRQRNPARIFADSVFLYNKAVVDIICSLEFINLKDTYFRRIVTQTGIKVATSRDSKLKIISWSVQNPYPTPPMCSNIALIKGLKSVPISLNGIGENDSGNNILIDTIIQMGPEGKTCYLLIGSNKCGNLCVQEIAALYSILNNELEKYSNAFYYNGQYLNELEFDYIINDKIRSEPHFRVENTKLISPAFNDDNTKQIGIRKYQIFPISSLKTP
jgi:hypothetical protein